MSERGKTLVAAAVLAAAVGVYLEISYQQKLKEKALHPELDSPRPKAGAPSTR